MAAEALLSNPRESGISYLPAAKSGSNLAMKQVIPFPRTDTSDIFANKSRDDDGW